jgi:hypothetical protein
MCCNFVIEPKVRDPCNRLVAAELEARWNRALTELAEAEARLDAHQQSQITLSEQDRNRLLELGSNLNAAWNEASTASTLTAVIYCLITGVTRVLLVIQVREARRNALAEFINVLGCTKSVYSARRGRSHKRPARRWVNLIKSNRQLDCRWERHFWRKCASAAFVCAEPASAAF